MTSADRISSVILLVFALVVSVESYRLDPGTIHSPQAGFLPFIASIALAVLSFIHLISTLLSKAGVTEKGEALSFNRETFPKVLYVGLSIFTYAILLNPLGFVLTTTLFIGFLLVTIEPQRWYTVVIGALSASLASYLLFDVLLRVQLPKGPLGF
jgi:putative tricarboxylic transport membrane protein